MTIQTHSISQITSGSRRLISSATRTKQATIASVSQVFGRCELDSHADTIVAGANCVILQYTGKECDVSPYREDYASVENVPIVHAATAWQSSHTGQTYILILHEALWMGDAIPHSLINPNQLRHHGIQVQDNPSSNYPLSIINNHLFDNFCAPNMLPLLLLLSGRGSYWRRNTSFILLIIASDKACMH